MSNVCRQIYLDKQAGRRTLYPISRDQAMEVQKVSTPPESDRRRMSSQSSEPYMGIGADTLYLMTYHGNGQWWAGLASQAEWEDHEYEQWDKVVPNPVALLRALKMAMRDWGETDCDCGDCWECISRNAIMEAESRN